MKITRRKLALVLAAGGAAQAQAQPQRQAAADDDLQAARDRLKVISAELARHELPMGVEPAFQFKP